MGVSASFVYFACARYLKEFPSLSPKCQEKATCFQMFLLLGKDIREVSPECSRPERSWTLLLAKPREHFHTIILSPVKSLFFICRSIVVLGDGLIVFIALSL